MRQIRQQFVIPPDLMAALTVESSRTGDYFSSIIRRSLRHHLADVLRSQECIEEAARLKRMYQQEDE